MNWRIKWALSAAILLTCSGCTQQPEKIDEQNTMSPDPHTNVDESEKWDFYICRVDDAAASILLDFKYRDNGRVVSADTLYWCQIDILEPGDHGMGIGSDAKSLNRIEDEIAARTKDKGFYYVGRLRNHGRWQIIFYGQDDLDSELRSIIADIIPDAPKREYIIGSKLDPEWSYYFEFLCPDAERWQWIMDRRVIENLEANGDPLTKPRRIDHWAYFDNADKRQHFVELVAEQRFTVAQTNNDSQGSWPAPQKLLHVL